MASTLSFRAAVALVIAGMTWGIVMAASGDHSTMPAHAHLNLLGWVSLFLMGIFYQLHPRIDASRLARIQVLVWIPAVLVQAVGVGLVHAGYPAGDPLAALSSIVILGDMLLFAFIVFRRQSYGYTAAPLPAE